MNRLLFYGLLFVVVLSPLPLGSNRPWSWNLCAVVVSLLTLAWSLVNVRPRGDVQRLPPLAVTVLFFLACGWIVTQVVPWVPEDWKHPLWELARESLHAGIPGSISLSAEDGWTALVRLLSYVLVFFLACQLGRDRTRAQSALGIIAIAGFGYAVFGLYCYWNNYHPEWLFGTRTLAPDVRSTFVNRNHFATWQGLVLLCAMAHFYQRMARPSVVPYEVPQNRDDRVVEFILHSWKPLLGLLVMVTALFLTHSRGGFTAALAGTIVLLWVLDRKSSRRKTLSRVTVSAALLVVSIGFYLTGQMLWDRIERTDVTNEERIQVFADVERGIADNPVLGFGYGTFAESFRLYNRSETVFHFDRAHNTWLENAFELGLPAAVALFASIIGLALVCVRGVKRRHRDWVYPAMGIAASVLVATHAMVDFSLQLPAIAILYAFIMGVACAQSYSSSRYDAYGSYR